MPKTYNLLTVPEAARQLGRARWWLYKRIKNKEIRICKIGDCIRIAQADLDDYIANARKLAAGDKPKTTPRLVAVEVDQQSPGKRNGR
jgi:excisionase family DNA binding protein